MTATYTFDVFSSLDGFGAASADWTGYWGKQGPELLDHRLGLYRGEQRMVFGANTYRLFAQMLATSMEDPLDWPDATVARGDAVDVVARLKEESDVPLRSHGRLSLNRALMAAGLVDLVQVSLFPVITGRTGLDLVFPPPSGRVCASGLAVRSTRHDPPEGQGPSLRDDPPWREPHRRRSPPPRPLGSLVRRARPRPVRGGEAFGHAAASRN
jgi:hypothetical protein